MAQEVSTHLYRIAQEATGNAVKHAHAESVRISFRRENEELILAVRDDGKCQGAGHLLHRGFELRPQCAVARGIHARGPVGEQEHGVVRAGVAVH